MGRLKHTRIELVSCVGKKASGRKPRKADVGRNLDKEILPAPGFCRPLNREGPSISKDKKLGWNEERIRSIYPLESIHARRLGSGVGYSIYEGRRESRRI